MKNQQRYILPLIALALLFVPKAMAQETEEVQYKTAPPQPGDTAVRVNALEYMLQKPQVSKRYEKKSFADRFFLEAGIGLNNTLTRHASTYIDWHRFGVNTNIAFGDWITPEHGVRIALEADLFRHKDISNHAKAFGFSADYMMNFSAVGNRVYEKPHRFEVIGLAGFDVLRSYISGKKKWVPSATATYSNRKIRTLNGLDIYVEDLNRLATSTQLSGGLNMFDEYDHDLRTCYRETNSKYFKKKVDESCCYGHPWYSEYHGGSGNALRGTLPEDCGEGV